MRRKCFTINGNIEDIKNIEELEESGISVHWNGNNLKVFYPVDMDQPDIFKEDLNPIKFSKSGDEGCGIPGSIEWHETCINQLFTAKEVAEYVKKVTKKKIKQSRIDFTKKRAIKAIGDYVNGNS